MFIVLYCSTFTLVILWQSPFEQILSCSSAFRFDSVNCSQIDITSVICGGAIPLNIYKFFFCWLVLNVLSLSGVYRLWLYPLFSVCTEFLPTGQVYSAVEKHSAMAAMRNVSGPAFPPLSHLEPTNFRIIPFLVFNFFLLFFRNVYCR